MSAHRPRKLDVQHVKDLAELYAKVIDHDVIFIIYVSHHPGPYTLMFQVETRRPEWMKLIVEKTSDLNDDILIVLFPIITLFDSHILSDLSLFLP